jgi:ABC-type Mn2+/Zn2+ transport system ATPase subunit
MNALSAYIASTGAGNPDVNLRRHLYNYIRIPGPAGSGKSALWTLYIDALKILDPKIKIAGTAHAERKVNDLEKQINSEDRDKSKHIPFSLLHKRIAKLEIYQDLYKQAESDLLSDLSILGLAASQPGKSAAIDIPVG